RAANEAFDSAGVEVSRYRQHRTGRRIESSVEAKERLSVQRVHRCLVRRSYTVGSHAKNHAVKAFAGKVRRVLTIRFEFIQPIILEQFDLSFGEGWPKHYVGYKLDHSLHVFRDDVRADFAVVLSRARVEAAAKQFDLLCQLLTGLPSCAFAQ